MSLDSSDNVAARQPQGWLSGPSYCKFTKTGLQQSLGTDRANC